MAGGRAGWWWWLLLMFGELAVGVIVASRTDSKVIFGCRRRCRRRCQPNVAAAVVIVERGLLIRVVDPMRFVHAVVQFQGAEGRLIRVDRIGGTVEEAVFVI